MIKSAKWIVIVAILMLGFGGCATITNTPKQQVSLVASGGGGVGGGGGGGGGGGPTTMKIPRKPTDVYVYAEDNPGYQYSHTSTFVIGGIKESPVVFLDILGVLAAIFPGLTSIIVDQATGSAWEYSNKELVVPVYKAAK